VGQISDVVQTPYGYHIIKVTDKKPAGMVPLAEVRPQIEQFLVSRRKAEVMRDWVAELRAQANVLVADSTGTLVAEPPPSMGAAQDSTKSAAR
jgi:peptidyl-prolyl cis-trans isomerase C